MTTVLLGENDYARDQNLKQLKEEFEQVEIIDGEETSTGELQQRVSAASLFASSNLIIVKNFTNNAELAKNYQKVFDSVSNDNQLVLVESSIDKRTKFYKDLKKVANVIECKPLDDGSAIRFVREHTASQSGNIDGQAANLLVARVGTNQQLLANELNKLLIASNRITTQIVEQLTEQKLEDSIFALTDALASGQVRKAIDVYSDLRRGGMQPHEILGTIGWQLETLVSIKVNDGSDQQIAKAAGLHPFVVQKNRRLADSTTLSGFRDAVSAASETDYLLKNANVNADDSMQLLLLRLKSLFLS